MKSNDEEYLDSLLNSAQTNNNNPQSALSRMSSRGKSETSVSPDGDTGDIGALVDNSNGNKELKEIGKILDRLDKDELIDNEMADLLDDIAKPTSSAIPKFTVGNDPTVDDVRDPEEIALDEAIANAERMDQEIQSGKYSEEAPTEAKPPIIDDSEENDALLEMAPEVALPEDNNVPAEKDSDADQTPEEILTDLLDDMPEGSLTSPIDNSSESLSEMLDLEHEANGDLESYPQSEPETESEPESEPDIAPETPNEAPQEAEASAGDNGLDEISLDNLSLDDIEAEMDSALGGMNLSDMSKENFVEEPALKELSLEEPVSEEPAIEEPSPEEEVAPAADSEETPDSLESLEEMMGDIGIDETGADTGAEETRREAPSLDAISEDDLNLDDLEASLDDLLMDGDSKSDSTEGEVAEVASSKKTPVSSEEDDESNLSMPDLDALMNSLANDEVEDIENTSHIDEEVGRPEDSEIPKGEILDALTESEFSDALSEPSLDDLAVAPSEEELEEEEEGTKGKKKGKAKKEKKEGFFSRLFKVLVAEDEEPEGAEGLASLTDENQQVLDELGEGGGKPKKEKKKKEKKPKEKKPKEKKPKEKKPPKPKKEKKPKPPKEPGVPERALSPKKVAISWIFAFSIGVLAMIPVLVMPNRIVSQKAVKAYNHQEYTTAYKMLYGKEMTEEQNKMYEQSRVLAWADRYLSGYQNYTAMNMEEEALDMLLMAKRNKADLLDEAAKFNVEIQVQSVYDSIESLLSENYGLTEDDIIEINSIRKERDYTIRLMEIVGTLES